MNGDTSAGIADREEPRGFCVPGLARAVRSIPFARRRPPRGFVGLVVLLSVVLALPSVFGGFINDDHFQIWMVRGGTRAPWDLFHFWSKDHAALLEQIRTGDIPWIVAPDAKLAFVRPLASLTHYFEYRFLAWAPGLMHAHNIAWYALLVFAVGRLYLSLAGRRFATVLALFLFALSSSGGVAAAWLCCRNTLMATTFGAFALTAHHQKRRAGERSRLGVALFFLSLLSGEMSAGSFAYFASYALFFDRGRALERALSVAPYALLAAVFWGSEFALGYGVSQASIYAPPGEGPVAIARAFFERYLPMLSLEYGWGNLQLLGAPELPGPLLMVAFLTIWVVALVPAALGDKALRFWLLGTLAALVPVSFALPQTRVLVAAHVGGAATIARLFELTVLGPRAAGAGRFFRAPAAAFALVWAAAGLVLGPLSMSAASIITRRFADTESMWGRTLEAAPDQDAFIAGIYWLTAPVSLATRRELGLPAPKSATILTNGAFSEFERVDEKTLALRAPFGILGPLGLSLRSVPFRNGETIVAPRCVIEIVDKGTIDPVFARFHFDKPLEDPSFAWFAASPHGFVRVLPPPVGARFPVVNVGSLPNFVR